MAEILFLNQFIIGRKMFSLEEIKEEISQKKALFNNFKTYYMARGMIFNVSSEHCQSSFYSLLKICKDNVLIETHSGKGVSPKAAFGDLAIKSLNDTKLSEPPNARVDTSRGRDSDQVHFEINLANHSAAPSVEKSLSASFDDECPNEKHDEKHDDCAVRHSTGFIYDRLEGSERDAFLKRIFGKIRYQKKLLEYTVEDIYEIKLKKKVFVQVVRKSCLFSLLRINMMNRRLQNRLSCFICEFSDDFTV
ncbi:hypothetical protein BpHYR1_035438 [Brachionus plicatilis]|uniref:Uncharacterized protein n=1 Tax=Brachionus plicatilis TaxID=10195 RepID=A0A3M7P1S1_BRAPC|nr:hypothetical protein BpHYR1_035438 [Brachionus plicatilis]